MVIIVLILLIIGYSYFAKKLDEAARQKYISEMKRELATDCPPHKWAYHPQTDRLTCIRCNFEAGSYEPTDNGNYDV